MRGRRCAVAAIRLSGHVKVTREAMVFAGVAVQDAHSVSSSRDNARRQV